jgi:hypothetical protein
MEGEMMPVEVLSPAVQQMRDFLEHIFGGDLDGLHEGLVEIAYTNDQNAVIYAAHFGTHLLDDAADFAAKVNARPGCNVYVGMALRRPDNTPWNKRTTKLHVMGTTVLWDDWDHDAEYQHAKQAMQFCPPTAGIVTGRVPETRRQAFWRLDKAILDVDAIERSLSGIQAKLGGDEKIIHADCVMRLPGSIAWAKPNKPERINELTQLVIPADRVRVYDTDRFLNLYPPVDISSVKVGKVVADDRPDTAPKTILAAAGHVDEDGREEKMTKMVYASFITLTGESGCCPTPQEIYDDVWPGYRNTTDFSRPGRGPTELKQKCEYIVRRFEEGRLAEFPDLDAVVEAANAKKNTVTPVDEQEETSGDLFETLDFKAMSKLPPVTWLVDKIITDYGLTIIYGDPASFKTFITIDMMLHVAYGAPWHSVPVKQGGILYIAGEGVRGVVKRIDAWRHHYGVLEDDAPFKMIPVSVNFMDPDSVDKLLRTIDHEIGAMGVPIRAVVIDTVARAMLGADENTSQAMGQFVAACDAVRHKHKTAAIGIHHNGKDRDRGMRGSNSLLGAVDTNIEIKRSERIVTLHVEKQKDAEEADDLHFKMEDAPVSGITGETSLVARMIGADEAGDPANDDNAGFTQEQINSVFRQIQDGWNRGDPWSNEPITRNSGRYLPRWCSHAFGIKSKVASDYIAGWIMNGYLAVEMVDRKNKKRGLTVVKHLRFGAQES